MKKPPKAVVVKERTVHTYSELWHASDCVLERGVEEPKGSTWQFLSSVILTAFSFEAYLNHVGPVVFECWPELERLSPWGKLELICETLKVDFPEGQGKRPLQTVIKLLSFRNTMAHGRSQELRPKQVLRDINDGLDNFLGEIPLTDWERLIKDSTFVNQVREDVKAVLEKIHSARPEPKELLFSFGHGVHSAELTQP
ncbi:hypothetical protein [Chitinivorax sp. B]|uniref:hypothetical protein n=1 Tax=Chitinivorax sp. B TaxID=2502235 RepID=UPI0010F6E5DF|nr:hypothetical protein [Chitinivorax sp. B]